MGHTVYYRIHIEKWEEFRVFLAAVARGLGYHLMDRGEYVVVLPDCPLVEPLEIKKEGWGFAKTNLVEPCHSVYLLILYSISAFGSVDVWED
ncbi:TonB-dependent receptor [Thermococcus sp. M36]|uniref:TonB-dependent receptor n=1 Tax=Thermococcus sp. M36 TaxID=1638261 RepID=UPI00143A6406|nr:TonB-dependent receptor [Thermococcus sp. M36]NJE05773.1 TonB-dependent receptor [Thermococcus sp. M36]